MNGIMKIRKYTLIAALALPMAAAAQTASVTFDTNDYNGVSVYDSWLKEAIGLPSLFN